MLSHGHYDHGGGIPYVLQHAPRTTAAFHPGALRPRYSIRDGVHRSIDVPPQAREALEALPPERARQVLEPCLLREDIGLTGPIPRHTSFEDTGGPFFLDPAGTTPDPLEDDLALWIDTAEGLVVCLGCAHAGVVNTLEYVRQQSGTAQVRAVIGGFHLVHALAQRIAQTVNYLRMLAPEIVVPLHCTGKPAVRVLQGALGDRVIPGHSGLVLEFRG
ncbi:MAG: MBL fold metallo-hydrolase [Deltaproteobacteria bacterium]|nr:MBL fold metallo-hydrolase [Deltaproteobacteria bacterium]